MKNGYDGAAPAPRRHVRRIRQSPPPVPADLHHAARQNRRQRARRAAIRRYRYF